MRIISIFPNFTEVHRVTLGNIGLHWVTLGSIEFYWVLLGFVWASSFASAKLDAAPSRVAAQRQQRKPSGRLLIGQNRFRT